MEVELFLGTHQGAYLIKVKQSEVLDVNIIKYKNDYFVFDSKRSTPFNPVFTIAKLHEVA